LDYKQWIFLLVKFFAKKRSPKQHAQGNSFKNYQKITIFYFGKENYEIMKNWRICADFSFLLLKLSYLVIRFPNMWYDYKIFYFLVCQICSILLQMISTFGSTWEIWTKKTIDYIYIYIYITTKSCRQRKQVRYLANKLTRIDLWCKWSIKLFAFSYGVVSLSPVN
jgi:hypothetical protein